MLHTRCLLLLQHFLMLKNKLPLKYKHFFSWMFKCPDTIKWHFRIGAAVVLFISPAAVQNWVALPEQFAVTWSLVTFSACTHSSSARLWICHSTAEISAVIFWSKEMYSNEQFSSGWTSSVTVAVSLLWTPVKGTLKALQPPPRGAQDVLAYSRKDSTGQAFAAIWKLLL